MSKITIDVAEVNVKTVLTILENLKDGLIENIHVDKSISKYKPVYQPKLNKVIKENEQVSGKYMNASSYKKSLNKETKI